MGILSQIMVQRFSVIILFTDHPWSPLSKFHRPVRLGMVFWCFSWNCTEIHLPHQWQHSLPEESQHLSRFDSKGIFEYLNGYFVIIQICLYENFCIHISIPAPPCNRPKLTVFDLTSYAWIRTIKQAQIQPYINLKPESIFTNQLCIKCWPVIHNYTVNALNKPWKRRIKFSPVPNQLWCR